MTKDEKKRERKLRKRITRKLLKDVPGKWLSNASQEDAIKIRKTFSQVLQGAPRASKGWSSADLVKDGIVGLYSEEKKDA